MARAGLALAALSAAAVEGARPHIVMLIMDDWGWSDVGYHRHPGDGTLPGEIVTPNVDALVKEGIELDRHYAFQICSPSRCSFQSGRLPVHVNVLNKEPTVYNANDPVGGMAGIPTNMTTIAQKMRAAGYRTHMTGKWDAGMATPRHTPIGRGYETWLGYFHHANDYYNEGLPIESTGKVDVCLNAYTDLWLTDGPANKLNGTAYEEAIFRDHTIDIINQHNVSEPLFMVHAFHVLHTPLQVPEDYRQQFAFINDTQRQNYSAMVKYMDDTVGHLVDTLKSKGMWENTLLVASSDNGGPIYIAGGANNWPHKGGKFSDWEGGVRVNAFVSGGYVPQAVRGTKSEAVSHLADWYATFCALAGVGTDDEEAANAGLHPVDSIDLWDHLSGKNSTPPRAELHVSSQALIQGTRKLVVGKVLMTGWTGPVFPNTTCKNTLLHPFKCQPVPPPIEVGVGSWASEECKNGCLFDLEADPTEHHDISKDYAEEVATMKARLDELNKDNYNPDRGSEQQAACTQAVEYGGFYGPWIDI